MTPPPLRVAAFVGVDERGENITFGMADDMIVSQPAINQETAIIAGGAVAAIAVLAALCCLWFFCFVLKRKRKEQAARAKLQKINNTGVSKRNITSPTMASVLGIQPTPQPNTAKFSNVLKGMNPALVKAPRPTLRNPRMSVALSAYKSSSAFKPTGVRTIRQNLIEETPAEVETDTIIPVEEPAEKAVAFEDEVEEMNEDEVVQDTEDDDYVDEDDAVAGVQKRAVKGVAVSGGTSVVQKAKHAPDTEASTGLSEQRKLIVGKGVILQEHVQKQTIKLRRVSHVKGDKDMTAIRQYRPSMASREGYQPQRPISYAFTATVSRTLVKTETDS